MNRRRYRNYLKLYRKRRGLSQKEVARILGLKSASPVSRWEHGVMLPETINAMKMAVLYETGVDAIYEDLRLALSDELAPRTSNLAEREHARR